MRDASMDTDRRQSRERESAREATSATTRLTEKKKAMHEFEDHLRAKETCRDDLL